MKLNKTSLTFYERRLLEIKKKKKKQIKNKSLNNSLEITNDLNPNSLFSDAKNVSFYQTPSKYLNVYFMNKSLSLKPKKRRNKTNENNNNNLKIISSLINNNNIGKKTICEDFDRRQILRKNNILKADNKRKLRIKIFNLLRTKSISLCQKFEHNNSKYNEKVISYLKGPIYFKNALNSHSDFKYNYSDRENNLLSTVSNPEIIIQNLPQEILKEKLTDKEIKLLWQKPNYYLYLNPCLKNVKIKDNKTLLDNFILEEKWEKITNKNLQKKIALKDIIELRKINQNKKGKSLEKKIEFEKEKVRKKISKMNLCNQNESKFKIGHRNIPEKLKREIDNNLRKTLKYSYSSEEIRFSKINGMLTPKIIKKNLKEYSLIKNKFNIDKGIQKHFKVLEKINKKKLRDNNIKILREKFIKMYK